ncbi:unnamed protein product [Porites evermanni]|uniref:Uncharacterized protein n=1 Tax=Porites evermanni TaxID=104178 RepID=A0ABN8NBQ9_9CNID|nr:unnamed protein product [Porites evermanni]
MLASYQLCFLVFLAAQLRESSSHSTGEEHFLDRFSSDTRCGWDCIITESDFSKGCDPVFTKKRLVKFNVIYDLFVNSKCLNQTSYKPYGTFTDNYTVWIPANNTLNSFSLGIIGIWNFLLNCFEEGEIRGFCNLGPERPTILASPTDLRTEAATTIDEKGYELVTQTPWRKVGIHLLILLSWVCSYYIPALLCLFSPTLVMESGIRHIVLEGASPVSIRALIGNNVFFKDCSTVAYTWYQKGEMFIVRLLFMAFLILLIAPGITAFNITPGFIDIPNFSHPFMSVCVTLYLIKWVDLLKISVVFTAEMCVFWLAFLGGYCLLVSASMGFLLTLLLGLNMLLLFPEKSLPFVACFLLFCYYLFSNYSSFTDRYHDLSLTIFNCYKKQTDQISQEEVDINTTNNCSDDKHNGGGVKIPKELFDMACEELKPVRESLSLLVFKVVFIASFLYVAFYLTMQLDFGVKPLAKTVVAVLIGLFPKILISKYFEGERQKQVEALIIEEKAPKIVEAYLNSVLRANEGQENSPGADTDEVSLQIVESEKNIAILHI